MKCMCKLQEKNMITIFCILKSLKKVVGSGVESGSASGSISQRYGSKDPDPHQNVMDPQHLSLPYSSTCWHTHITNKICFFSFFTKGFDLSADNIGWKNIFDHSTAAASMEIFPPTGLFRTFLLSGEKV
jgi:hypothetical protein